MAVTFIPLFWANQGFICQYYQIASYFKALVLLKQNVQLFLFLLNRNQKLLLPLFCVEIHSQSTPPFVMSFYDDL